MKLYIGVALACLGAETAHANRAQDEKSEYIPQLRRAKSSAKPSDKSEYPIFSRNGGIYNSELVTMASTITNLTMDETRRHLQTLDELWSSVNGNDGWDDDIWNTDSSWDDDIFTTIEEIEQDWDDNRIVGDANFFQCAADTSLLIAANPNLEIAISNYISSMTYTQVFDPSTFTIYTNLYYAQAQAEIVRRQCALAGGYLDVNVGALTCELFCSTTTVHSFVNCLANTQECRAKGNFEHLQYGLEGQGFNNCRAPERPAVTMPPTFAPRPATPVPIPTTLPPRPATLPPSNPRPATLPPRPLPVNDTVPAPDAATNVTANVTAPDLPITNLTSVALVNCSAAPECISHLRFNFTGKACPPSSPTCTDYGDITFGYYSYTVQDAFDGRLYVDQVSLVGYPITFDAFPVYPQEDPTNFLPPFCFDRLLQITIKDLSETVVQTSLISSSCSATTGIGKVFMTDEYGAFELLGIEL